MSRELASMKGREHTLTVSTSSAGIELAISRELGTWQSDAFTPQVARAIAAILREAADQADGDRSRDRMGPLHRAGAFVPRMPDESECSCKDGERVGGEHLAWCPLFRMPTTSV